MNGVLTQLSLLVEMIQQFVIQTKRSRKCARRLAMINTLTEDEDVGENNELILFPTQFLHQPNSLSEKIQFSSQQISPR